MSDKSFEDLKGTLNACADALEMRLSMSTVSPHPIFGDAKRPLALFGAIKNIKPTVSDSLVDVKRGIVVLYVRLVGSLYCIMIGDSEAGLLQLLLIDRSKLKDQPLPRFWNREHLYRNIYPALKATYSKKFYDTKWTCIEKGKGWMDTYFERKKNERTERCN